MSPEQADGRAVTERCDQYALGSVMYALLAGRPPFRAKTMPEMLQLQRFAEPEPVRRFVPQTPDDLDRLIRQLLSKDPAARFPNVLVLGRHMEAMQRALSRPGKPAASAPEAGQLGADAQLDATTAFNTDVTLAPEDLSIVTLETDSNVFDAPTLADDVQGAREPSPATGSSQATATLPLPPAPTTRFTTVDEEAERQRRQQQAHHWSVAFQLAGLAAALAAVMWVGWRLARPPTADAVFAVIDEHVSDEGTDDLGPVSDEIADFLDRFPNDPRAAGVRSLADELELQKRERQLRFRARMSGDNQTHPIVEVFTKAARLQNSDPAKSAAMLRDLLALYPRHGGAREALDEQMQTYLTLAERQLAKLQTAADQQAAAQLPVLQERLAAAARLEASAAADATAIYRAVVELYADQPWAAPAVDEARRRLAALAPE
jgi:serine/threonine-protein kinase